MNYLNHKILPKDEITGLFDKVQQGDVVARDKIVTHNMRLVMKIARSYQNRGYDLEDLVQEGTFGLMKACEKFEPERGNQFSTYATWWIKQAIGRYIANNGPSIRYPAHVVGLSSKLTRAQAEYRKQFNSEASEEELAFALGVSVDIVKAAIAAKTASTLALDTGTGEAYSNSGSHDSSGDDIPVAHAHASDTKTPYEMMADAEIRHILRKVFDSLTEREQKILRLRFGISEDPTNSNDFPITESQVEKLKAAAGAK